MLYPVDSVIEFFSQLIAFIVKNTLLLWRARLWQVSFVAMPVVAVVVLATLERSENVQPAIVLADAPFFELNTSTQITCRVFDSLSGRLGLGIPIADAWCTPMLFAPSSNQGVLDVMSNVADRKDWTLQILNKAEELDSELQPESCANNTCLLGFRSSEDLSRWLLSHRARAATAIVFRDRANATSGPLSDVRGVSLPEQVLFEVWYNDTALEFYTNAGDNRLAGEGTIHEQLLVAQHAVEEGILEHMLGQATPQSKVLFRRYPLLERKDFRDWTSNFGHLFFLSVFILPAVMTFFNIMEEKASGTFGHMRQAGMHEMAWWLAFGLQTAMIVFLIVCVMVITGLLFSVTIFMQVDFSVLLGVLWVYGMALLGQILLIASIFPSMAVARYVLFFTFAGQAVVTVLMSNNVILLFDPTRLPQIVPNVVQLNAVMAMAKVMYDITSVVRRVPEINDGLTLWVPDNRYTADHLYAGNYTGELRTLNIGEYFVAPPTIESIGLMAASFFACGASAWYLTHITPRHQGRTQRLWFFLNPRFWWPSDRVNGNDRLIAELPARLEKKLERRDEYEADVWMELQRVLEGRVPPEHNVVLYDLEKKFGKKSAVNGVSVALADNEIFALLGHNGAGKSTIINMITGSRRPTSGDALVWGRSVLHDLQEVRRIVGHCSQHDALFSNLTPREHLFLYGRIRGVLSEDMEREIPIILEDMRLADVADLLTHKLSGGMKRRLSCAIAYIGNPRLVVLDEPTTGMDPYNRKFVWEMIEGCRMGRTTLLTTHLMEEADALGNVLGIMAHGQLVALGTSVHLKRKFGKGYSIKLVTKATQAEALRVRVMELMPNAELVDMSAGSLTFSISADDMHLAGPLLAYIEALQKKRPTSLVRRRRRRRGDPKLIDWIITRSTLEDVFFELSSRHKDAPEEPEEEEQQAGVAAMLPLIFGAEHGIPLPPVLRAQQPSQGVIAGTSELEVKLKLPQLVGNGEKRSSLQLEFEVPGRAPPTGPPVPPRRAPPAPVSSQAQLPAKGLTAPPLVKYPTASGLSALIAVARSGAETPPGQTHTSSSSGTGPDEPKIGEVTPAGVQPARALPGRTSSTVVVDIPNATDDPADGVSTEAVREAQPWKATALKNLTTLRRSPAMLCCSIFMPLLIGFTLFAFQDLLVDEAATQFENENQALKAHVTEACARVSDAYDFACKTRSDLSDLDDCRFCATANWEQFSLCCQDENTTSPVACNERFSPVGTPFRDRNVCSPQSGVDGLIDFGARCPPIDNITTPEEDGDTIPSFCYCTAPDDNKRSDGLQERIDRTAICSEYNRVVLGRLTEDQVGWVPSDYTPDGLDEELPLPALRAARDRLEQDSWLGWRVPVFDNASSSSTPIGSVSSELEDLRAYIGTYTRPVFGSNKHVPYLAGERALRLADLSDAQRNRTRDLASQVSESGFLRHFPRAIGRTSFGTRSNQPTASCTVSLEVAKCCYELAVKVFDIFQVFPDSVFEYCGTPGGECPDVWTNDDALEYLREEWKLSQAQAENVRYRYLLNASDYYYLGIGESGDFKGRPTQCKSGEPPICWLIRERTSSAEVRAMTCAEIRSSSNLQALVSEYWSADDYSRDRVWKCLNDVQCVQYEMFVVPAYGKGPWKTQEELDNHVLEEQIKIRSNLYTGPGDVDTPGTYKSRLNVAEFLFPSWSVQVNELDLEAGQVEWVITSFFRRQSGNDSDFFYVSEPIERESVGGAYEVDLRLQLDKPFALQRTQIAEQMPAMFQNSFVNAILRARVSDTADIKVGLRPMPSENEFNRVNPTAELQGYLALALRSTVPLFSSLLMPVFTYSVVQEKQFKLRSLMKMMGLRISSYWSVEWAFASTLSHCMMLLLWGFGCVSGLRFFRRSWDSLLFVSQVWAQLQVAVAFLGSVFFWRTRPAMILMYFFIFLSCGIGLWLWELSEQPDSEITWQLSYDAYPPFAFFHCVYILTEKGFHLDELFNTNEDFSYALLLMVMHLFWLYPLAVYLDAVLPRELGASEHPLFCLQPLFRLLRRRRDKDGNLVDFYGEDTIDPTAALNRDFVKETEDVDVTRERAEVEMGRQDPARSLVQAFSLRKVFPGGKVGINNLTMRIDRGECFGLLGPNGAGKTTTISVLSGLYRPTSGTAVIAGHNIRTNIGEVQRSIGVCPQFDTLWPKLTVRDHMLFYSRVRGVPAVDMKRESERIVRAVDLSEKLDADAGTLSGGQKRRVSVAISLVGSPPVIFLDEPTTGLDPQTKRLMWKLINDEKAGRVIVLTTHSMDEADALCDRIGIMANGELLCLGTNIHLKNKFGDGYKIVIVHSEGAENDVDAFMASSLPKAMSVARAGKTHTFAFARGDDVSLREVFEKMERRPKEAGIEDWSLRQTSLQEVFVTIAIEAEQAEQDQALRATDDASQRSGIVGTVAGSISDSFARQRRMRQSQGPVANGGDSVR